MPYKSVICSDRLWGPLPCLQSLNGLFHIVWSLILDILYNIHFKTYHHLLDGWKLSLLDNLHCTLYFGAEMEFNPTLFTHLERFKFKSFPQLYCMTFSLMWPKNWHFILCLRGAPNSQNYMMDFLFSQRPKSSWTYFL